MTQIQTSRPSTRPVTLDVLLVVRQADKTPAAGVALRIVVGTAGDWQAAAAGSSAVSDNDGAMAVHSQVVLETRRRKLPSNFLATLLASRESTRYVQVGVALEYAGRQWLSVVGVDYFASGAVARLDPMRVFGRATDGRFTDDVPLHDGSWHKRLPSGIVTSLPGFTVTSCQFDPHSTADDNDHWTLKMAMQLWPAPVVKG